MAKRGRHAVELELATDSEEEARSLRALIEHCAVQLHAAGLIDSADGGQAAIHLFSKHSQIEGYAADENVTVEIQPVTTAPGSALAASPSTQRTGDWTCQWCGNVNFEGRVVCNMRKCNRRREDGVQVSQTLNCSPGHNPLRTSAHL